MKFWENIKSWWWHCLRNFPEFYLHYFDNKKKDILRYYLKRNLWAQLVFLDGLDTRNMAEWTRVPGHSVVWLTSLTSRNRNDARFTHTRVIFLRFCSYPVRRITVRPAGQYPPSYRCTLGWDKWNTKSTCLTVFPRATTPRPNFLVRKTRDCHHRPTYIIARNTLVKHTGCYVSVSGTRGWPEKRDENRNVTIIATGKDIK